MSASVPRVPQPLSCCRVWRAGGKLTLGSSFLLAYGTVVSWVRDDSSDSESLLFLARKEIPERALEKHWSFLVCEVLMSAYEPGKFRLFLGPTLQL